MANILKQLTDLLRQDDARRIGKVISVNSTAHTTTLSTPGGGVVVVTGTGVSVGLNAFYKDGALGGAAADLPVYEIDV